MINNLDLDSIHIEKPLTGGVGGDILFYVSRLKSQGISEDKGILKIFIKQGEHKKEPDELKYHKKICKHKKLKYYIPQIYCSGICSIDSNTYGIKHGKYHYMILENVESKKSEVSGELYKVIKRLCIDSDKINKRKYLSFICNILWQLALIIFTFIKIGYTHCDIHPKNIFIKEVDNNYPNIRLSKKGKNYAVCIIDFGEIVTNNKKCIQLRKKSKVLASTGCSKYKKYTISKKVGSNISALYNLSLWTKKKRSKTFFNSDIWFYFNLLKQLKLFYKDNIKNLDIFINNIDKFSSWTNNNMILFLNLVLQLLSISKNLNITQKSNSKLNKYNLLSKKELDKLIY
jgi:hypothetical protein